jgi:hypothetical protein
MAAKGSLPCSRHPAVNGPYPEPQEASPPPPNLFLFPFPKEDMYNHPLTHNQHCPTTRTTTRSNLHFASPLHHRVQNGSGAHPASYQMSTRGSFPGGKAAGAWSWPITFT